MTGENVNVLVRLLLRHRVLFVLLCDAVARGIIQSLTGPDQSEPGLPADEGKKRARKTSRSPRDSLDAAAGQDVLKALQVGQAQHISVNISIYYGGEISCEHTLLLILLPRFVESRLCESCD